MLQQYHTKSGILIERTQEPLQAQQGLDHLVAQLDSQRGALFASTYEYPGRYTCWDLGFYNPPLVISAKQDELTVEALNQRGEIMLKMLAPSILGLPEFDLISQEPLSLKMKLKPSEASFSEEERSKQPSVFTLIRHLIALFQADEEQYLGLYGAFGFDLIFQFEPLNKTKTRDEKQRDMVLYFPDELYLVDHRKEEAYVCRYDFIAFGHSTVGLARTGASDDYQPTQKKTAEGDHQPGEYVEIVEKAKERFACGDLFEVVPSQTFYTPFMDKPSQLFTKMKEVNPSPYGFLINLGEEEYLVGASPEMYVRVQGRRVETCPISGTIKRGQNAIEDAKNIQKLLESKKEESELTMCTDVDRNDKSRICEAGSVRVIGRRQIELYSRLIHTVDHVEGTLREGFDAVDAFLSHMWVVTVTGAPKLWALNFIEEHEKTARRWYAGAVGYFAFNGDLNTGLVLRTVRLHKGLAEVRVGATLLYDSIPEAEEEETRLKASAFLDLLKQTTQKKLNKTQNFMMPQTGRGKKVMLVDHQDSFVHTLANYIRQTGADVVTLRYDKAIQYLEKRPVDLVVLSPGPGRPVDFHLSKTIDAVLAKSIPLFGVCLGLQGIVEYYGGVLDVLDYPMHGKPSQILVHNKDHLFRDFPDSFEAGRYHSLHARKSVLPKELMVTAESDDGIIMGVSHRELPIHAVQFHPETILSLTDYAGHKIIANLVQTITENQ